MVGECLDAYTKTPRSEWVRNWPGQAVLCVGQKYWTTYVHESIRGGQKALEDYLEVCHVIGDAVYIYTQCVLST